MNTAPTVQLGGDNFFFLMNNQDNIIRRHQGGVTHVQKRHSHRSHALSLSMLILSTKSKKFKIHAIINHVTPTIQSSQKVKFKLLV